MQRPHAGWPTASTPNEAEIARLGAAGVGVAHCPSSNMMIGGGGIAPVADFRAAGVPVGPGLRRLVVDRLGLAVDGGPQRHAARAPAGRARPPPGPATRSSWPPAAARLPRPRRASWAQLSVGAVGDLVCWPLEGVAFAGALSDPVEAWLRCGPVSARHTVVAGRTVVEDGVLVAGDVEEKLRWHRRVAERFQARAERGAPADIVLAPYLAIALGDHAEHPGQGRPR